MPDKELVLRLGRYNPYVQGGGGTLKVSHHALGGLYTSLDRILGGKRHKRVHVDEMDLKTSIALYGIPSATDGTQILIAPAAFEAAIKERGIKMLALFGLNFHELAHVFYTPRLNKGEKAWVNNNEWHNFAFNVLEDMRIEHMLRQEYERTTVYFLATVATYFFDITDKDFNERWRSYAALCERRYIPREDRLAARDVMVAKVGEEITVEVEEIAAAWVRMTNLTKQDFLDAEQKRMVRRLAEILADGHLTDRSTVKITVVESRTCSSTAHDSDSETVKDVQSYGEIGSDDTENLAGQQSEGEADGSGGGYSPTGHGEPSFEELQRQIQESEEIKNDLRIADSTVRQAVFKVQEAPPRSYYDLPVTTSMRKARKAFRDEIEKITERAEPGWLAEQPSGRLNILRAIHPGVDPTTAFDTWEEDHSEETRFHAVMLGDMSSSMSCRMTDASESLWVIGSTFASFEGELAVMGFSDYTWTLPNTYKSNTYDRLASIGGTAPRVGIAKARWDLTRSKIANKLFIIFTDGSWHDSEDDKDIARMNKAGVVTAMIKFDVGYDYANTDHNCQHIFKIHSGEELVGIVKKLATTTLKATMEASRR